MKRLLSKIWIDIASRSIHSLAVSLCLPIQLDTCVHISIFASVKGLLHPFALSHHPSIRTDRSVSTHPTMSDSGNPTRGKIFTEKKNAFECIVLDLRQVQHQRNDGHFLESMQASLREWKADGVRGVSTFVPNRLAHRIPQLVSLGFDFHHAQPGYVLMLFWLSETSSNNFPAYAHHFVGCAGFVVNEQNEVLVIKETFSPVAAQWKLPGGGSDAGEDISVAAMREVFEETGIKTEFVGVLCCRHLHEFRYKDCSDMYFVCLLKPLNSEIKRCELEIQAAQWMHLDEFSKSTNLSQATKFIIDSYHQYTASGVLLLPHEIPRWTGQGMCAFYRPGRVGGGANRHPEQSATSPLDATDPKPNL